MTRYSMRTNPVMHIARMAASLLLALTACGNVPATQDRDSQTCLRAASGECIAETDDAGGPLGDGANGVDANDMGFDDGQAALGNDELGFDLAAPIPPAETPALTGTSGLDRLLFPSFGESLFDFFVAGMLLGPDGLGGGGLLGDGGSLLFGDDEPASATNSQRSYLEELCRRLGQSDSACRQRYGE